MLNAVIIDFNLEHVKKAILKLEEDKIINIKYWLVAKEFDVNRTIYNYNNEGIEKSYLDVSVPSEIYQNLRKQIYSFINFENRYNDIIETQDYLHNFYMFVRYWYRIFKDNNIALLMMDNLPHGGFQYIAYLLAKEMNIKVIMTSQMPHIHNRFMCCKTIARFGCRDFNFSFNNEWQTIERKYDKDIFYMKNIKPVLNSSDKPLLSFLHNKNVTNTLLTRFKSEKSLILYFIGQKIGYKLIRTYLKYCYIKHRNDLCQEFDKKKNFVYFPLHLQPEMTTDTLGGIYEDQLLCLEKLSSILPKDWVIYVKENPKQTYYKRSKRFFRRFSCIKNVSLVPPETNTYDLIKYSKFVSTITGTVGWEAITGGKNVLIFGYAWYRTLPGVFEYNENLKIDEILKYKIDHNELEKSFNDFYRTNLLPGVIADQAFKFYNPDFTTEKNNDVVYNSLKIAINNY